MSMTTNEVIIALMSGTSLVGTVILRWLDRKKLTAERKSSEVDMYNKLLASVQKELEIRDLTITKLRERERNNEERVKKLNDEIRSGRRQISLLEENNLILKMEIDFMRKMLAKQLGDYDKMSVFILDDSQIVTLSFKDKLEKSSLIDVQIFSDVDTFIAAVSVKKPAIVIIDYYLKAGKTSESVIAYLKNVKDYSPNIIIMSKDDREEFQEHLAAQGAAKFYKKEGLYIFDIVKYVLEYAERILS